MADGGIYEFRPMATAAPPIKPPVTVIEVALCKRAAQ